MAVFNSTLERITSLFRLWLRVMVLGLRIAPLCFVLVVPAVALYDRLSPWPPAIEALSAYPAQTRICVGIGSESRRTPTQHHSFVERSFVLLPRAFSVPSVTSITSTDSAAPVVEESRSGFWFGFAGYLSMLAIVGWLLHRFSSDRHSQSTGNV